MDALAAEIARLRAELAREKDGRARAEAEKDSLARLATSSLIRLGLNISEPVGIWIREDEQQRLEYLLEASEVDRMLASEGTWTRTMIQPRARASSPAFASPIVPLRVSIPAEVFDLVASFVDLRTRSVLSRVDFAWFVRFHPLAKSSLWTLRKGVDRRRLVSLLSRDPTVSPRLESRLSLRNVTVLSVFSSLIEDDAFPELSLDKLGLGGSPVRLQRLEIVLIFDKQFYPAWSVTRALRLSPQFLLLLDPAQLLVRERASTGLPPPPVRLFGGSRTDYYSQRATLDSVQVNRAAADAMCSWTRLGEVHLIDLDLHITQDDQQTNNTTAHAFFLHLPVLPSIPSTSVWWLLKRKPGFPSNDSGPQVLATPIRYLAARQPLEPTRIKRAYLVLPEEKERLVEKARTDVPALIKIIAAIGEEEEA